MAGAMLQLRVTIYWAKLLY